MSNQVVFSLRSEALQGTVFGTIAFNGKFVFELDPNISPDVWQRIGFIPTNGARRVESTDFFEYLNARLPIYLRNETTDKKLNYIKKQGLRVTSDAYYLQPT